MLHLYKTVLLAIKESDDGTAKASGDTHAMLAHDLNLTPLEAEQSTQQPLSGRLGSYKLFHAGSRARMRFSLELSPARTLENKPPFAHLLEACGMTCQTTAPRHRFILGDSFAPVSLLLYSDGLLHQLNGALGNMQVKLDMHQRALAEFEFLGLWNTPALHAVPQASFADYGAPLMLSSQTCQLMLGGNALAASSIQIDLGNNLEFHETFVEKSIMVTNRRATASLLYQAETHNNPEQNMIDGDNVPFSVLLNDNTRRISIGTDHAQWQNVSLAQQQGLWWWRGELAISDGLTHNDILSMRFHDSAS